MIRFTKTYAFLITVSMVFLGCGGLQPSASKGGKKLYEQYFIGTKGSMFFIKPLSFQSDDGRNASLDITFTNRDIQSDTAVVNISFTSNVKGDPTSLLLNSISGQKSVDLEILDMFFIEREKDDFKYRYSSRTDLKDMDELFRSGPFVLIMSQGQDQSISYSPTKRTEQSIDRLVFSVFDLLR